MCRCCLSLAVSVVLAVGCPGTVRCQLPGLPASEMAQTSQPPSGSIWRDPVRGQSGGHRCGGD